MHGLSCRAVKVGHHCANCSIALATILKKQHGICISTSWQLFITRYHHATPTLSESEVP